MIRTVYIKTTRTKKGYARGEIHRFVNFSDNKIYYSFNFYQTYKCFNTYKELREFVENNYELLKYSIRTGFVGMEEYHLPENKNELFN